MGTANHICAWGIAPGLRNIRDNATRLTASICVAVLVGMATAMSGSTMSPAVRLAASTEACERTEVTCAYVLGGTTVPTPDDYYVGIVESHFVAPTHPKEKIDYVAVTTPEEAWPITGLGRVLWRITGPAEIWGPGGPAWPDEPWWKLSGLFDLTFDQSVRAGVADLESAMAANDNDHVVVYGYSQGAMIANLEKRKLAGQYPVGTPGAPDIDFVLSGDPNLPNGGVAARFPGLYVPILDVTFNGPAPTNTQFHTVEINRQYEGISDFPLYPLNLVADLNAVLGVFYVHPYDLEVSLAPDPANSPAIKSTYGDTDYYFFETEDLPLFGPLRTLGVPEPLIDVVEPFFRVVVELGYDRTISPGQPTPARLIPMHDPVTVVGDLVDAIGEGFNNALALFGAPTPPRLPAPAADSDLAAGPVPSPSVPLDGVSPDAAGSQPPAPSGLVRDELKALPRKVGRGLAARQARINETVDEKKSLIGDWRSDLSVLRTARKTPVRDTVKHAGDDIMKDIAKVSDRANKALSGGKHGNHGHQSRGDAE
jgi:PE-PPE domain